MTELLGRVCVCVRGGGGGGGVKSQQMCLFDHVHILGMYFIYFQNL